MIPLYWMHEQTGETKRIVLKYFKDEPLTESEFSIIKGYIEQWIKGVFDQNRLNLLESYSIKINSMIQDLKICNSTAELRQFVDSQLEPEGLDPF